MMANEEYDNQFNSAVEVAEAWIESELGPLEDRFENLEKDVIGGVPLDQNYPEDTFEPKFIFGVSVTENTFALYDPRDGEFTGYDVSNLSSSDERMKLEHTVQELDDRGYKTNVYAAPD